MPRRSTSYQAPRDWIAEGEWPDGVFASDSPDVVAYAVHVARLLGSALEGANKSQVAQAAEVDRKTLYGLVAGTTWGDMVTLAKLEKVLGVRLWPDSPPELYRKA